MINRPPVLTRKSVLNEEITHSQPDNSVTLRRVSDALAETRRISQSIGLLVKPDRNKSIQHSKPPHIAALKGDLESLRNYIHQNPSILNEKIDYLHKPLLTPQELHDRNYISPPQLPNLIKEALLVDSFYEMTRDQRWLIQMGFSKSTLLHYACIGDQLEIVQYLLENYPDIDVNVTNGANKLPEYYTESDAIRGLIWSYDEKKPTVGKSNKMPPPPPSPKPSSILISPDNHSRQSLVAASTTQPIRKGNSILMEHEENIRGSVRKSLLADFGGNNKPARSPIPLSTKAQVPPPPAPPSSSSSSVLSPPPFTSPVTTNNSSVSAGLFRQINDNNDEDDGQMIISTMQPFRNPVPTKANHTKTPPPAKAKQKSENHDESTTAALSSPVMKLSTLTNLFGDSGSSLLTPPNTTPPPPKKATNPPKPSPQLPEQQHYDQQSNKKNSTAPSPPPRPLQYKPDPAATNSPMEKKDEATAATNPSPQEKEGENVRASRRLSARGMSRIALARKHQTSTSSFTLSQSSELSTNASTDGGNNKSVKLSSLLEQYHSKDSNDNHLGDDSNRLSRRLSARRMSRVALAQKHNTSSRLSLKHSQDIPPPDSPPPGSPPSDSPPPSPPSSPEEVIFTPPPVSRPPLVMKRLSMVGNHLTSTMYTTTGTKDEDEIGDILEQRVEETKTTSPTSSSPPSVAHDYRSYDAVHSRASLINKPKNTSTARRPSLLVEAKDLLIDHEWHQIQHAAKQETAHMKARLHEKRKQEREELTLNRDSLVDTTSESSYSSAEEDDNDEEEGAKAIVTRNEQAEDQMLLHYEQRKEKHQMRKCLVKKLHTKQDRVDYYTASLTPIVQTMQPITNLAHDFFLSITHRNKPSQEEEEQEEMEMVLAEGSNTRASRGTINSSLFEESLEHPDKLNDLALTLTLSPSSSPAQQQTTKNNKLLSNTSPLLQTKKKQHPPELETLQFREMIWQRAAKQYLNYNLCDTSAAAHRSKSSHKVGSLEIEHLSQDAYAHGIQLLNREYASYAWKDSWESIPMIEKERQLAKQQQWRMQTLMKQKQIYAQKAKLAAAMKNEEEEEEKKKVLQQRSRSRSRSRSGNMASFSLQGSAVNSRMSSRSNSRTNSRANSRSNSRTTVSMMSEMDDEMMFKYQEQIDAQVARVTGTSAKRMTIQELG